MRMLKKPIAVLFAFLMVFSSLTADPAVFAGTGPETVVEWNYTAVPSSAVVPATGGELRNGAELTNFKAETPTYSSNSLCIAGGWEAGSKYWQISLSTQNYEDVQLSFKTRSSGTGPRDFKVEYSTSGALAFNDVSQGTYTNTTSLTNHTVALPAEAENCGTLVIRFTMTGTTNVNGTAVAGGGTSNINNIIVEGTRTGGGSPQIDKSALVAAITSAQGKYDAAVVGTAPGQYPQSAREALGTAIAAADTVNDDPDATQAEINAAVTALGAAVSVFDAAVVGGGTTIAQARALSVGTQVTVTGVVTRTIASSATNQTNSTVFIQDGTAGIAVYKSNSFKSTPPSTTTPQSLYLEPGTSVTVKGALTLYNGLLEVVPASLSDVTVNTGVPVTPAVPRDITVAQLNTRAYEGQLVRVTSAAITLEATNSNHTISQSGVTTTLRCVSSTNLPSFNAGDYIDVVGIGGNYNGTAQLLVQSENDICMAQSAGTVTASPGSGAVEPGDLITLSPTTTGAIILYSINDGAYQTYTAPFALTTLPAAVKAYAQKGSLTGSIVTFNYTLKQIAAVRANPSGGNVPIGSSVALTCDTAGATIKYSTDGGSTYQNYTGPITITQLPAVIKAYAVKAGLADGPAATFTYGEGGYNFYFGQLHSHTNISDGQGSVQEAFNYAKNQSGVDFLAVTDHSNSFDDETAATMAGSSGTEWKLGHDTADEYTDSSFVGIYGFEMTWSGGTGHINTFNTPGYESRNTAIFKQPDGLQQYYNILKRYPESISQFNHPGTVFGDFNDFANYDEEIDDRVTLIEVGNGEGPIRGAGYFPSYSYYTRALDKGWHLAPANNQDNHKGKWGNSNTARTVALADSLTRDDIYDAMKNMRIYATEDEDLEIMYTLNDSVMGTVMNEKPEEVAIKVDLKDPDNEALGTVSVVVNGGRVAASKTVSSSDETVEFTLPADYSYYYIRVDQADRDIAVTAPVWIDNVEAAGIAGTKISTTLPLKGDQITVHSDLYNNEETALTLDSLTYSIDGNVIHTAAGLTPSLAPLGTAVYEFPYTFAAAGSYTINVQLTGKLGGVEKIYNDVLRVKVGDPALTTRVVVDATHYNDYVYGYYANNINNFTTLANQENISVHVEKDKLTDQRLEGAQMLIISAPAKTSGTSSGITYSPSSFTDEDLAVIKKYVDNGGNLIVMGLADYQDGTGVYQSSTQLNRLLTAIGATTRINNDEVADYTNNLQGQFYRLAFNSYDMQSPYLSGVVAEQNYSFYSGCSIDLDEAALASGKTKWLVKGHSTTGSVDSNNSLPGVSLPNGSVYALAVEELSGGGRMFIGGTVFISDFEVKATLDNYGQLQNSNYNITMNILDSVKKNVPATNIADIRKAEKGSAFAAEGTVTAGTVDGNAFFDTIYIQDETGGINIFPAPSLSEDIRVGQKVGVTGTVDEYQGDLELRIIDLEVTDTSINPKAPTQLSAKDSMDSRYGGMLVKVSGKVTKVNTVGGVISEIFLDDGSGKEARVFIDGYIGYSNASSPRLEDIAAVGADITAIGLASADPEGARLRVRDRSEITAYSAEYTLSIGDETAGGAGYTRNIGIQSEHDLTGKYLVVQFTEGTGNSAKVSVVMISVTSPDAAISYQIAGTEIDVWLVSAMPDLTGEDMRAEVYAHAYAD